MCGWAVDMIVGRVDEGGDLIWSWRHGDEQTFNYAYSIIETDNASFLTSGGSYDVDNRIYRFIVTLLNGDGESVWLRDYGEGTCFAIIELKSREFMLAGSASDSPQLILIDGDGEVIWRETYELNSFTFMSLRETEGGVVTCGNRAVDLVKVNAENGEVIWSESHNVNITSVCEMTSTADGGFAIALYSQGRGNNWGLFKVYDEGQRVWVRYYEDNFEIDKWAAGVERLNDGGFAIVGREIVNGNRYPMVIRTNASGVERWRASYNLMGLEGFEGHGRFYGVTRGLDGSIIGVGVAVSDIEDHGQFDALLMKLEPEVPMPMIFTLSQKTLFFQYCQRIRYNL